MRHVSAGNTRRINVLDTVCGGHHRLFSAHAGEQPKSYKVHQGTSVGEIYTNQQRAPTNG